MTRTAPNWGNQPQFPSPSGTGIGRGTTGRAEAAFRKMQGPDWNGNLAVPPPPPTQALLYSSGERFFPHRVPYYKTQTVSTFVTETNLRHRLVSGCGDQRRRPMNQASNRQKQQITKHTYHLP
mmetsp:Transcript_21853/g.24540  ORF Transcript_21853/g.24540 Transcript_21853/m.24540 type:complete len:123 (+) Transcript_21853:208-576(+)